MKVFITGDRSMPIEFSAIVAAQAIGGLAIEALSVDDVLLIATGENRGVETGVREVARTLGVSVEVVPNPLLEPLQTKHGEYVPDWDRRHKAVAESCDRVVVIHSDLLDSRIGASCVRVVPDEKLLLLGG